MSNTEGNAVESECVREAPPSSRRSGSWRWVHLHQRSLVDKAIDLSEEGDVL